MRGMRGMRLDLRLEAPQWLLIAVMWLMAALEWPSAPARTQSTGMPRAT
ncbi:MAG TPA: hypothetical protein VMU89_16505 [Thermomicrobiaceae bacterium]|nr:hypothetical protein [Thermomicrobiaceae bacterium]